MPELRTERKGGGIVVIVLLLFAIFTIAAAKWLRQEDKKWELLMREASLERDRILNDRRARWNETLTALKKSRGINA